MQEGQGCASRCQFPLFPMPIPFFPSTKSRFLCASYWGCWPGCGKIGLCERNTERWELKSRIGKGRVTLWVHRMCCGKLNRRIWEEKSAQLWGLRAFTICFAAWATLRKGTTLRQGAILPRSGLHLPAGQGCGRLPVPTARADCCGRLPGPTCRRAAGPGAVSRTCTGRRARWLGILPFRVCRRGLRCCGFSPLRGARILSCLSQGT